MSNYKPIARNNRARYDFNISTTLIAGIVLNGAETKSVRQGHVSAKGAYANFHNGELFVTNLHISPYPAANLENYEPTRRRKLLLHKKEILQLVAAKQNGQHVVVLSIGLSGKYIKLELGIGSSRKNRDKRQVIKKRQAEREAAKQIKRSH